MSTAGAVTAILASAVIVLGGLVGLVRAIWKIAQTLRDNTAATTKLTGELASLRDAVSGRLSELTGRVTQLESRRRRLAEDRTTVSAALRDLGGSKGPQAVLRRGGSPSHRLPDGMCPRGRICYLHDGAAQF